MHSKVFYGEGEPRVSSQSIDHVKVERKRIIITTSQKAGVPSRSLPGLPVFYFDRIRVGRLHLHLHLRHEGAVPDACGKRRTEEPTSKPENPGNQ